jgi:Tfp pilus assembly protein FimT
MAKKAVKTIMQTCTAQMQIDESANSFIIRRFTLSRHCTLRTGLVFIELIMAITIVSMMMGLALIILPAAFGKSDFQKQADAFISTLKMARTAAAETDRRYAVILDFDEGTYTLREYATLEMDVIPPEQAIIKTGLFTEKCQLDYVIFDDLTDTRDWNIENMEYFRAVLFAGHSGWQNGAKIVLRDADGNPYSVITNRLTPVIKLQPGDVDMLIPQENLRF